MNSAFLTMLPGKATIGIFLSGARESKQNDKINIFDKN